MIVKSVVSRASSEMAHYGDFSAAFCPDKTYRALQKVAPLRILLKFFKQV